jgi:hypothetical protein
MEHDEPLYLLATRPQIEALRRAGVLAWNSEEVRAPRRLSARERAEELAARLALKRAPTRADGEHVALDFPDLAAAVAFVARLRHDVHHQVRIGALVNTGLAEAIEEIEA